MLMRMTLATVQQQLSTPEGFSKAVDAKRTVATLGWTSLALGAAAFAFNLFSTGQAVDWNWSLIGMTLFRPDLFEYSSGRGEAWAYVYAFAPIILVPLGIILLIVHFSTRKNAGSTLFADFQSRGWVGKQRYTGLQVKNGNQTVDTVLVSHPSIPDEQFDAIALQFQTYVTSLDKKALKAFTASASKSGVLTGVPAAVIAPGIPAEVLIAPAQGKNEFAVVVPPAPGASGKFKVLPIKS